MWRLVHTLRLSHYFSRHFSHHSVHIWRKNLKHQRCYRQKRRRLPCVSATSNILTRHIFSFFLGNKNVTNDVLTKHLFQVTKCKCQVINIGAGFDTLYWNLKNEGLAPSSFIELDFPDVTMQKCHYIKTRPPLLKTIHSEGIFHSANFFSYFFFFFSIFWGVVEKNSSIQFNLMGKVLSCEGYKLRTSSTKSF